MVHVFIKFNPFVPNAPFLYSLITSEHQKVFWCFQGVEKGSIGNKRTKWAIMHVDFAILVSQLGRLFVSLRLRLTSYSLLTCLWNFQIDQLVTRNPRANIFRKYRGEFKNQTPFTIFVRCSILMSHN